MRAAKHVLRVLALLVLFAGLPLYLCGAPKKLAGGADAISSPTVVLDQPSGAYVAVINREKHTNPENLTVWEDFFSGREIDFLFEDISGSVSGADAAGLELAKSFQSRLPENQMELRLLDPVLLLSKLYYGMTDLVIFSREYYDAVQGENYCRDARFLVIEEEGL